MRRKFEVWLTLKYSSTRYFTVMRSGPKFDTRQHAEDYAAQIKQGLITPKVLRYDSSWDLIGLDEILYVNIHETFC
jgi:ATP:corrinoid adenosyltransferase